MAPTIQVNEAYLKTLDPYQYILREDVPDIESTLEETISTELPEGINAVYFTIPNQEGQFQHIHGKEEYDGTCHYRIAFRENENKGTLTFILGVRDKRAINRYEAYIKPACKTENYELLFNQTANKLSVISSGKVFNNGDCWQVDKNNMPVISFEHVDE